MQDREGVARTIASTVPQLLGVQVETADTAAADAVSSAVERIAEELLRWHDRLMLGDRYPARATPELSGPAGSAMSPSPEPPSLTLRVAVRRGVLPGRPVTLQLAASELRAAIRRIEGECPGLPDVPDPDDAQGRHIANQCLCLATALDRHGELLHVEGERLARSVTADQRDQVLARVVRAEHHLTRAAAATLAP